MNKRILYGPIQFFDPPMGDGRGEGGTSQSVQQIQAQQTQQSTPPPDPFANVDLDLLDDNAKQAITQARTSLQRLQSEAQTASQHQSRADQLQAQIQQYEQQIQSLQQPGQTGTQPQAQTDEQKLAAYYQQNGLQKADAERVAKLNAGAFNIISEGIQAKMGTALSPVLGRVVQNTAQEAFLSVQQNDPMGMLQIPEVAQATYDQAQAMAGQGQMVDPRVISGIAKIKYIDHLMATGGQPALQPSQNVIPFQSQSNQLHQAPMINNLNPPPQSTRFSYPGAGNLVQSRGSSQSGLPMDADTAAAVAATIGNWDPKLQQGLKTKGGMR